MPALAQGLSVAAAGPASAHAALRSSDPADGASLPTPPEQISLVFTEPVLDGTLAFSSTAGAEASSPSASQPAPAATVTDAPAVPNPGDQAEDGGVPSWVWLGGLVVLALLGAVGGLAARRRGARELPAPPIR